MMIRTVDDRQMMRDLRRNYPLHYFHRLIPGRIQVVPSSYHRPHDQQAGSNHEDIGMNTLEVDWLKTFAIQLAVRFAIHPPPDGSRRTPS